MRLFAQRILVAFMVCWLPFCCCQARVAANALVHLSHGEDAECCASECCGSGCCDTREAADHGECCGGGDERGNHGPTKGSCCVLCKERALPPASPSAIDEVSASTVDFVATALLADAAPAGSDCHAPAIARPDGGPPPRPSGRHALRVHSKLVI